LYHQAPDLVNRPSELTGEEIPPVDTAPRDAQLPRLREGAGPWNGSGGTAWCGKGSIDREGFSTRFPLKAALQISRLNAGQ